MCVLYFTPTHYCAVFHYPYCAVFHPSSVACAERDPVLQLEGGSLRCPAGKAAGDARQPHAGAHSTSARHLPCPSSCSPPHVRPAPRPGTAHTAAAAQAPSLHRCVSVCGGLLQARQAEVTAARKAGYTADSLALLQNTLASRTPVRTPHRPAIGSVRHRAPLPTCGLRLALAPHTQQQRLKR
eukprot:COSAG01_NODE_25781_length_733_cov_1.047319_1_plen_182_part_01